MTYEEKVCLSILEHDVGKILLSTVELTTVAFVRTIAAVRGAVTAVAVGDAAAARRALELVA